MTNPVNKLFALLRVVRVTPTGKPAFRIKKNGAIRTVGNCLCPLEELGFRKQMIDDFTKRTDYRGHWNDVGDTVGLDPDFVDEFIDAADNDTATIAVKFDDDPDKVKRLTRLRRRLLNACGLKEAA